MPIKSLIKPMTSILKMADRRFTETIGEVDVTIRWGTKSGRITLSVLKELSSDLIHGTDWIKSVGGISIYPSVSQLEVKPMTTSPDFYSTDGPTPVPPQSLTFL